MNQSKVFNFSLNSIAQISISAFLIALMNLLYLATNAQQVESYNKFEKLKITQIEPQGWIKEFLERQKSGLTGHIEVAGYPYNTCLWACEKMEGSTKAWWPYEQTAYYLDGVQRLGYLLNDDELINIAKENTKYVSEHISANGRFGTNLNDRWWRWPYASFNRLFMLQYEISGNEEIINLLANHYKTFKAEDFCDDLELANVEELCWLYEKTGDKFFIETAEEAYRLFKSNIQFRNRSEGGIEKDIQFDTERIPDHHGVVYMELAKIPVILYSVTGNVTYLQESENALQKMEQHHMLASGLPSTTEHFKGISETAGYEICNTAVFPYTYGFLQRANGDANISDKIEKAVFNAGIGSITKDFKAHQYFSAPNQVLTTSTSNTFGHHSSRMAYSPGHDVECCTGNVNRFMPYYVEQMWLQTKENGLVASLYGPSKVSAKVGEKQTQITIIEETNYPFSEEINFKIETEQEAEFSFFIRIPQWCQTAKLLVNNEEINEELTPGNYYELKRSFANNDKIKLVIPMEIKTQQWPNNGVSIERGPLVYSLPIEHMTNVFNNNGKSTEEFPAYSFYPIESWQYSPIIENLNDIEVVLNDNYNYPWDTYTPPIKLLIKARKVENWELAKIKEAKTDEMIEVNPKFPDKLKLSKDIETLELIPFGNTLLRLTVFPETHKNNN